MKTITGTILETSPYNLHQSGFTDIHEVRIQGDDGTTYVVQRLLVCRRLSNAIQVGTHATFTIYKTLTSRTYLVAINATGKTEIGTALSPSFLGGIIFILAGIPLLPFLGVGLFPIFMGFGMLNMAREYSQFKASLLERGEAIETFKVV
jgi:hypothetical protein